MDPELFQRMQEAAARFNAGETDFEEIMTPAGPAHLVRDPSDPRGFRLDFVGDGAKRSVAVQRYPATPMRPMGYPAPLPFLPECESTVNTLDQTVTWADPPGGLESFELLIGQMEDDEWERVDDPGGGPPAAEARQVLSKEGAVRTLTLESGEGWVELTLQEKRDPRAPTSALPE